MRVEPLYGLPVEEYGDVEGWSINADQPGTLLAVAIAAELSRIETAITAMETIIANIPHKIQAGILAMPTSSFRSVATSFYDGNPCVGPPPSTCFWRAEESIVFNQSFDATPTVVVLTNRNTAAGTILEATVATVTQSGFTASLATFAKPVDQWTSGWIAMERTQ